jgi:predicted TIM-barrel fold metal-dependent hydrolase
MIIDGHAHACGDYLYPESIILNLNQTGTDKVVLVPGELGSNKTYGLPNLAKVFPKRNVTKFFNVLTRPIIGLTGAVNHIEAGNEYVYDLKTKCQNRVIQFIWITRRIPNPIEYLTQKFIDWKFQGIKMHQCWERFLIDSSFFMDIAEWAEMNGVPLFIHLWSDREVKKIIKYKKQHKILKLIIGHLFGLELFIEEKISDENLFFDTSTVQVISTYRLMTAIKKFGVGQILFGSDTPYGRNNLQKNIDRINSLTIGEKEKNMILGDNLRDLLKI